MPEREEKVRVRREEKGREGKQNRESRERAGGKEDRRRACKERELVTRKHELIAVIHLNILSQLILLAIDPRMGQSRLIGPHFLPPS
jgi:hypothetical protein